MPMGSRMPSCASTRNSCGSTCKTSRSSGMAMFRAASMARRTSSRSMSRARFPSEMPPRLLTPRTWLPATPITADSTGTLATPSASSTARRMELTVESRLTINPLRSPFDSAAPSARKRNCSFSISASKAQVFVLPISSPTRYLSFFAKTLSCFLFCSCHRCAGVGVHHHLPRIPKINRVHGPGVRLPLREVFHQRPVFAGEIALAKMHGDRRGVSLGAESCQHGAQIARIAEVGFADAIRGAGLHQVNVLHELLIDLHALFAFIARQIFRHAGDNREMKVFAFGTFQKNAMPIDQREFAAVAEERHRRPLCDFHAQAIRRDAQHAAVTVVHEEFLNLFSRNDVIPVDVNLVRLDQHHLRRIERIPRTKISSRHQRCARNRPDKHTAIKRPSLSAEFLPADIHRLLPAQILRLFVGHQIRPVRFLLCRRGGGIALDWFHAFQTTTSFSRVTP